MAKPPPKIPRKPPSKGKPAQAAMGSTRVAASDKSFSVAPMADDATGQKILIYGKTGIGKSSLAMLAPGIVHWIMVDDGARNLQHPVTGERILAYTGVNTYQDVIGACQAFLNGSPEGATLVLDTITKIQALAEEYVVANIRTPNGGVATSLESYNFGKGWRYTGEAMRSLLDLIDEISASGRHVVLIGQETSIVVANAAGDDYLQDVPKLVENKMATVRSDVSELMDVIAFVTFDGLDSLVAEEGRRTAKARQSRERVVYTGGAAHFLAKSRTRNGVSIPETISYESPEDDSFWRFIFPDKFDDDEEADNGEA